MLGSDQVHEILEKTLRLVPAEHAEVFFYGTHNALTRFANNGIHQNVAEANTSLTVRAVEGKRVGIAETNDMRPESLERVARRAAEIARSLPENPEFLELVRPTADADCPQAYFERTANCTPLERAERVRAFIERAKKSDLTAAGSLSTAEIEMGVYNTMGVAQYQPVTEAQFQSVVMEDTGSGWVETAARNLDEIDLAALAEEAVQKALDSSKPRDLEPGTYPVLLEEAAVETLAVFLSYLGFNARAFQEGRSCLNGKLGVQVASPLISIWDDGLDPHGMPVAFDYEGTAKEKLVFVDKGVARALAYDSFTANKEGGMSTGHALPATQQSWGPVPMHLFMGTGDASFEDMLAGLDRGLYISRFHYTNVVEETGAIITGMTRDGVWWVENGKIQHPVKNLRFTQGILEALQSARRVSRRSRRLASGHVMPALLLDAFHFSSKTTF